MSDQRVKKAEDRQELILRLFNPAELQAVMRPSRLAGR